MKCSFPVARGSFFFIREDPPLSSGGILFTDQYARQFRKAHGWVMNSNSEIFQTGDQILVSVGVERHLVFGDPPDDQAVYVVFDNQVEMRLSRAGQEPYTVEVEVISDPFKDPRMPLNAELQLESDTKDEGMPSARPEPPTGFSEAP